MSQIPETLRAKVVRPETRHGQRTPPLQLECAICGEFLCEIEPEDTLYLLVSTFTYHYDQSHKKASTKS